MCFAVWIRWLNYTSWILSILMSVQFFFLFTFLCPTTFGSISWKFFPPLFMKTKSLENGFLQDLQKLIDGSPDGVIYFSMGSNLRSSNFKNETTQAFLEVFSQLKQRVLWKWETDSLPGQPSNVKLGKWLPQADILGELVSLVRIQWQHTLIFPTWCRFFERNALLYIIYLSERHMRDSLMSFKLTLLSRTCFLTATIIRRT